MNKGLFASQINESGKILDNLKLIRERNIHPKYASYAASFFRTKSYSETWQFCYDHHLYDFSLTDDALIQFRPQNFSPLEVSYVYLECPFKKIVTYEEFIEAQAAISEEKDEFEILRDYDFYISSSQQKKENITPIRYDYSPQLYVEARHPASHFHFGYNNEMRISTKKVLRPLSFTLFILRQRYTDMWIDLVETKEAEILCRNIRENLDEIQPVYWNTKDELEMILI